MHIFKRVILLLALAVPAGGMAAAGCGNTKGINTTGATGGAGTGTSNGGAMSGTTSTGTMSTGTMSSTSGTGAAGTGGSTGTGFGDGGTNCLQVGSACMLASDCCSGTCTGGVCNLPACTSDNKACASNAQCCSGNCTGGTCVPLPSGGGCTGKTLGNACTVNADCCSGLCLMGVCSASSFCNQNGDACATGAQCCGGICNKSSPSALYGTCSQPPAGAANCGLTDGSLCAGGASLGDGGLPACGGNCCSRLCAPYGPTQVLICQPASGCHVVGDLCTKDSDCCGSAGLPGGPTQPVTCSITPPATVGTCRNPIGCKPDGDICKLATMSCNASCDCCSGNCENLDTCKQDNLGVPRCAAAQCVMPGGACASSANCCNNVPCVPNPVDGGTPPYICYQGGPCVPDCGKCTTNADCCPGTSCIVPVGSADGVCGPCLPPPDGGSSTSSSTGSSSTGTTTSSSTGSSTSTSSSGGTDAGICGLYGQECSTTSPCCNSIPCLDMGGQPCAPGETGCTCHVGIQ